MNKINNKYFSNYGADRETVEFVEKVLGNIKEEGYFKGENNVDIYYEKYCVCNEKGRIVISHGFSECLEKYNELIYYFTQDGYSVYAIEHRGHGRSGYLGKRHKSQVNVEKFEYYVEDLKTFLDEIVIEKGVDLYLYAHSMGGGIGTLFLEKYSGYFKKAILSAPMMEINTGKYSKRMSYLISVIYKVIGKGDNFIIGQGAFDGAYNLNEAGSSNKHRYENHLNQLRSDEVIQRGGGSFNWINESLKATNTMLEERNIKKIDIPILLFQAGRDTFVKDDGHNRFCEKASNCKKIRIENAKHELFMENDEILFMYLDKIKEFIK